MNKSILDFSKSLQEICNNIEPPAKYTKLVLDTVDYYSKLEAMLGEEVRNILKQYELLLSEQERIMSETHFKAGIKLGIRFMFECIVD